MRYAGRLLGAALILVFAGWATAQNQKGTKAADAPKDAPVDDMTFVMKAAADGKHEVMLGELAKAQAASADLKKFAEKMVTDHTKANEELMAAAKAAKIAVPGGLPEDMVKEVEKFKALKGAEFDRMYARHMVEDHEKAVKLFENASMNLRDPGLKGFATKTLPVIKEHLEMAKKLSGGTGGTGSSPPIKK